VRGDQAGWEKDKKKGRWAGLKAEEELEIKIFEFWLLNLI
jgi:hypothetical protein